MKQSTPEAPKPPQHKSILMIGPPGGGKTTLLMQFPRLVIIDCDENLDGPERYIRSKINKDLSYGYVNIWERVDGKPGRTQDYEAYDRLLKIIDEVTASDAQVVAIDSLTHISEFIIQKVLKSQKQDRTEMEARDWIPYKSHFLKILVGKLRGMNKHTICTVHETKLTEPDPKNIMNQLIKAYEPSVHGSIVDYFGAFFTDMWRCSSEPAAGGTVQFKLNTMKTAWSDLKNSCGMPPTILNPTFAEINKYLKL